MVDTRVDNPLVSISNWNRYVSGKANSGQAGYYESLKKKSNQEEKIMVGNGGGKRWGGSRAGLFFVAHSRPSFSASRLGFYAVGVKLSGSPLLTSLYL